MGPGVEFRAAGVLLALKGLVRKSRVENPEKREQGPTLGPRKPTQRI